MNQPDLLIHYYDLPKELFITLKDNFHTKFCQAIQSKLLSKHKNCFYIILKCQKYHAKRLFNKEIRFRIKELEELREFSEINKEEIETNIENIGNQEDGTIILNPKLPFHMNDLIYVASHLMFDGNYRNKKGCYFYSYEEDLTSYHKERLSKFGEVPINFMQEEYHLYFSYTLGFISSKILEIFNFNSLDVFLSDKFKKLVKENKKLLDEFIKAMIIDEGEVNDCIRIELGNNQRFVEDIYEVISNYYQINKSTSRKRDSEFKGTPKIIYKNKISWRIVIKQSNINELYHNISPLPIDYKEENLRLMYHIKNRKWKQRKPKETKKLIIKSLLNKPKSILELSKEIGIRNTTMRFHIKGGHPNFKNHLIKQEIVKKVEERILRKGGYTKADIFGIDNIKKAKEYLSK